MNITFTIEPMNNGGSVTLHNTTLNYSITPGNDLVVKFVGALNGAIVSYQLTSNQVQQFVEMNPVILTTAGMSSAKFSVLPDDFYRVQIFEKRGNFVEYQSPIVSLSTFAYVQNNAFTKIVHTERIVNAIEKQKLNEIVIHLKALEILGVNPPLSMEHAVVNRIKLLKTLR